jgi:hypothetical protein
MKGKTVLVVFLFVAIQVIAIVRNWTEGYLHFFWFCDFVPLLFAFAFLISNDHLAKGLINVGLIPQIVFIGFFIYNAFTGSSVLFTIPDKVTLFYDFSAIFLHLSTTIALVLTYRVKPTKETLMYSLLVLILMYTTILAFTSSDQYINYVYSSETIIPFSIPYYTLLWIPIVFAVVIFPTHLIQLILYKRSLEGVVNEKTTRNLNK